MKVLVISSTPWANDNSFGSTFSNFFEGMEDVQLANIFCMHGKPNNQLVQAYFQVTQGDILRNLRDKTVSCGKDLSFDPNEAAELGQTAQKGYDALRIIRWQIFFWGQDLIWKVGRWKSEGLRKFLKDFSPDLIFQPIYYSKHMNDLACYCAKVTGAPMVGYVSDDVYTYRRFSLSPLYWLDVCMTRPHIKKLVDSCEWLYVISDIQKTEYENIFRKECKILTKSADFSGEAPDLPPRHDPVVFSFTGNIGGGRWKSLALLAAAVEKLNTETKYRAKLNIYTASPVSKAMERALNRSNASELLGRITPQQVQTVQKESDVLVHVEGLDLKNRLAVHQSLSTKLVDYFRNGRCIFAIGTQDMASISHLTKNDVAVVATSKEDVYRQLLALMEDESLAAKKVCNAWNCGKAYHNKANAVKMLQEDFQRLKNKA